MVGSIVILIPFGIMTGIIAIFDNRLSVFKDNAGIIVGVFIIYLALITYIGLKRGFNIALVKDYDTEICLETSKFESSEVKEHFINDCCFGEDFAKWVMEEIKGLDFKFDVPIQEDYGWGFWAEHDRGSYWVAFSCAGENENGVAEWYISINYDPGLNFKKILSKTPDPDCSKTLKDKILTALQDHEGIKIISVK